MEGGYTFSLSPQASVKSRILIKEPLDPPETRLRLEWEMVVVREKGGGHREKV